MYHKPVLLEESLERMGLKPGGIYVDCTFGGGGHSRELLSRLDADGRLFAFDQDPDAWENALDDPRFCLIRMNFRHIKKGLRLHGVQKVDGILADLGVSSHQFDAAQRGFSLRFEGPLDMRMNPLSGVTAADWLEACDEKELRWVLNTYGEVPNAGRLAAALRKRLDQGKLESTAELSEFLEGFAPAQKIHSYKAQVFQALRIVVNQEMEALRELLADSIELLSLQGRLVIISYHSLEDRMVKQFMREGWADGDVERDERGRRHFRLRPMHRKPLSPDSAQIEENTRARSAKLRAAERLEEWV